MRLRRWARRMQPRAVIVAVVVAALVAGGLVVAFGDPPARLTHAEVDGRTWLPVSRSAGDSLVLANGISGLVEAEAISDDEMPGAVGFAGSDRRSTLMRGEGAAVVVADGIHRASVLELDDDVAVAIVGGRLLTVGATSELRTIEPDGSLGAPRPIAITGPVRTGTDPVVDDDGTAWLLTDDQLVSVHADGRVGQRRAAPDGATGLMLVDGQAFIRSADAMRSVDGSGRRAGAGPDGVAPAVAVGTADRWAVGDGSTIVLGDDQRVDAGGQVDGLAVWYGAVWWSSVDGVHSLIGTAVDTVADLRGPYRVFHDGGRLWFVGPSGAVAVDDRQAATVFRLTSVDLSLCIDDCSPDDAIDRSEDPNTPTTTSPDAPPPPTITLPPVLPTAPTTTTTTTTTEPPSTTERSTTTTTTTTPATDAPAASTTAVATTTAAAAPTTSTTALETVPVSASLPTVPPLVPTPEPPDPPAPPGPPDPPDPPGPPDPPAPPVTTAPPPATTVAPGGGNVILAIGGSDPLPPGTASIAVGFDGTVEQCQANGGAPVGANALGMLQWSGAGSGARTVSAPVGGSGSESIDVGAGDLTVTFSICGLSATATRRVAAAEPTMGEISISGVPTVGETLTAAVAFDPGVGWSVAGTVWSAGRCPPPTVGPGSTGATGSSVSFTPAEPGRHCVSVVVSFVADGGGERSETRSASVEVDATTTTTASTTTTTTTSTTPSSTTAATSTTVGSTTTAPVTTAAPPTTATPTTAAPPTTATPTTAATTTTQPAITTTTI
ncbi:MAG: hypothetical protein ACK5OX_14355 [Desertimonas sp.]